MEILSLTLIVTTTMFKIFHLLKHMLRMFHLPMNIRSLHLHFDELFTLLTNTGVDLEIIGLSETKYTVDSPSAKNTDIPGYKFYNTPSQSAAGGVGIYVKSSTKVAKRIDLSISTFNF